jgi:hypothetical protein
MVVTVVELRIAWIWEGVSEVDERKEGLLAGVLLG